MILRPQSWYKFAHIYQEMIDRAKDGDVFVELGTFLGDSALDVGKRIRESGKDIKFYTVDYFNFYREKPEEWIKQHNLTSWIGCTYEMALEKLEPVKDYVTVVKQNSWEPIKGVNWVDFCWIDASHEYEDVYRDIEYWLPRSKVIGGDDYGFDGVRRAVSELCIGAQTNDFWLLDPNIYYDETLLHLPKIEA